MADKIIATQPIPPSPVVVSQPKEQAPRRQKKQGETASNDKNDPADNNDKTEGGLIDEYV